MKAKGFEQALPNNKRFLKGKFAGYPDCYIVPVSDGDDLNSQISGVSVVFPEANSWEDLMQSYNNIKEMTKSKYGEPIFVEEKFEQPNVNDSSSKFFEAKMERCKYLTAFKAEGGLIVIQIQGFKLNMSCSVAMRYLDDKNLDESNRKAIEDL